MNRINRLETIENYITIEDGLVTDSKYNENLQVSSRKGFLSIKVFADTDLQIIFSGENDSLLDYKIDLKSESELNLVEVYQHGNGHHQMVKQYLLHRFTKLHKVVINDAHTKLTVSEKVDVHNSATCETVFAELSQSSVNGTYNCDLVGDFARAKSLLAAVSYEKQQKVFNVAINHLAKCTEGQIENFGVNKDFGHLTFNGTGFIAKDAKQSKAHQNSKILVFDQTCVSKVNPYLIIDENDVEASHAAALGQMDEEQLFYLQSRGLTPIHASKLITYGYLMPVALEIENEALKEIFIKLIEEKVG